MYHRISDSYPDPWKLNVSESNFQEHLELFNKNYHVLPLKKFNELRNIGRLPQRALAITFDDGYADNVAIASPLLRKAEIPATFYICTGTLGQVSGMWWDTLAQIVFGRNTMSDSEKLDHAREVNNSFFNITMNGVNGNFDTTDKSIRNIDQIKIKDIYMQIWKEIQKIQLEQYSKQMNFEAVNTYPMMQDSDVKSLSEHNLFEIGAHTQNHVQLSAHNTEIQEIEIQENVQYLKELTGRNVRSLSYPFGAYNSSTLAVAKQAGFDVACTTVPEVATRIDDALLLPRITVYNDSAKSLQAKIDRYF